MCLNSGGSSLGQGALVPSTFRNFVFKVFVIDNPWLAQKSNNISLLKLRSVSLLLQITLSISFNPNISKSPKGIIESVLGTPSTFSTKAVYSKQQTEMASHHHVRLNLIGFWGWPGHQTLAYEHHPPTRWVLATLIRVVHLVFVPFMGVIRGSSLFVWLLPTLRRNGGQMGCQKKNPAPCLSNRLPKRPKRWDIHVFLRPVWRT